ncbi:translocase [Mesobaculum littorinae]|uniref:Translocase n=1 Tax=Mesobaculum littorinae TaxID=2486419 RepID=A0A438AGP4_9RHOB|nr:translocase [Mesobaculum littorinae]RVV97872.1 translocase [Mesobaculum littorinae]
MLRPPGGAEAPQARGQAGGASDTAADCQPSLTGMAVPGGMVHLTLTAPCHAGNRIELRQGPLLFADSIADDGTYMVALPALTPRPEVELAIDGGDILSTRVEMPEGPDLTHVALQWEGQAGMHLHALEFGAGFGDAGHVWADAPGEVTRAVNGQGGFLTELGDPALPDPLLAEVYTLPREAAQPGTVTLSVEAAVTETTCGRDIRAETLQSDADGLQHVRTLSLAMPGCDAVGEIVVLKNLLRDLKIAAR